MKLILTIIVTLSVAVGLGMMSANDPGYVVLARDPYVVRLPLLLFVLMIIVGFLVLYLLFGFIASLFGAPRKISLWRDKSNENAAHKYTMQGYAGLIEGNWSSAEASLLKKLEYNKTPLMNYLGAAYAAQQQGNFEGRNGYLNEALDRHPGQYLAITLTRARLHYQAGEVTEARDSLESLRKSSPKNGPAAKLLADVYRDLEDWDSLVKLVPAMRSLKLFPAEEIERRERAAYDHLIGSPALLQGEEDRQATTWKSLPRAKKKDPVVIGSFVKQLIASDKNKEAEDTLRKALLKKYSQELMYLYGKVKGPVVDYQIRLCQSFMDKRGPDPDLLLALARLYRYDNQLEISCNFYRDAISAGAREEAYSDLGSLLEQMGDTDAALQYYKKRVNVLLSESDLPAGFPEEVPALSGDLIAVDGNSEGDQNSGEVIPVIR
jgi:HemY protein